MKQLQKLLYFVKPYWRRSLVALILLIAVVFMDLSIPRLIQRIIDQGITQNNMQVVIQTTLIMLGISAVDMLFAVLNNNLSVQVGESVARDVRDALFKRIQSFSWGNLDRLNTGVLMVRLSSDTTIFQRVVQISLRIGTRAPFLMLGSLILMFSTDRRLALMMLPLLLLTIVIMTVFVSRMEPLFYSVQQKMDRLNAVLQENIAGVRVVKSFVRDDYEKERFGAANQDYAERSIRVMQFLSTMMPALSIFVNIGMVIVLWSGGLQAIQGNLTLGQIVAFNNYLLTTLGPLTIMAMIANVLAAGAASAERISEVLEMQPEVQNPAQPRELPAAETRKVTFEHVTFRYHGCRDQSVLDDVNLTAEPGQTVAILGATGSGKSTLVNLIPRFYDACGGRVAVDGVDVRDLKQDDLFAITAIVPQDTVLFTGTVSENIRYGKPDATDAEVIEAAKAAQAHDFIALLENGYDTYLEERGGNLSGGQKQRVAIARALVMRPQILILDDSTSSVDVETEVRIQNALKTYAAGTTVFIVAQRISTVLGADKIVVIDHGRIVSEGTHAELMRTSPIYQEIYASQLGDGFTIEMLEQPAMASAGGAA
ncbi:MAG: ABC transporter ATP-binding protein [Anaerolineales bacterium]|nr:ABC transporter ATP-binding protein [Anaerolineales bacterium]